MNNNIIINKIIAKGNAIIKIKDNTIYYSDNLLEKEFDEKNKLLTLTFSFDYIHYGKTDDDLKILEYNFSTIDNVKIINIVLDGHDCYSNDDYNDEDYNMELIINNNNEIKNIYNIKANQTVLKINQLSNATTSYNLLVLQKLKAKNSYIFYNGIFIIDQKNIKLKNTNIRYKKSKFIEKEN